MVGFKLLFRISDSQFSWQFMWQGKKTKTLLQAEKTPNLSYKCILDLFIQENDGIFHSKSILCCRNDLAITLLPLPLAGCITLRETESYAGLNLSYLMLKDGFPPQ